MTRCACSNAVGRWKGRGEFNGRRYSKDWAGKEDNSEGGKVGRERF